MTDSTTPAARADALAARRRARDNCGACGGAWFGEVAYCPYCGRASIEAVTTVPDALPEALAPQVANQPAVPADPADPWTSWAKPLVTGALLGVLIVVLGVLVLRAVGYSP
jgi:hypothetical protein